MTHSKVTISDVAREAGVSIATVSRVIQGRLTVAPHLMARVQTAARELGYRPNPVARSLATGATGMVGILVPQLANPYFHRVIKAIGAGAEHDGYRMLVLESDDRPADEPDLAASLYPHTDGVILFSPRMSDDLLQRLAADHPRLLCVNRIPAATGIAVVAHDPYPPTHEICTLLRRLGHRRVTFLSGSPVSWVNKERWRAVQDSAASGLVPFRVQAGLSIDEGYAATDAALEHDPTALIGANDLCAIGALTRLRELGLRVPEDISVTGFDDIPFSAHTRPTLTTARVPQRQLGERVWTVMRSILAGEAVAPRQPLMTTEVVVRDSTGPARGSGTIPAESR